MMQRKGAPWPPHCRPPTSRTALPPSLAPIYGASKLSSLACYSEISSSSLLPGKPQATPLQAKIKRRQVSESRGDGYRPVPFRFPRSSPDFHGV